MKTSFTLSILLLATLAHAADDPEAGCRSRLRNLGGAISAYRLIHEKKPPAKLSDLYLDGLVTSLEDFVCPASGSSIKTDSEIDAKSDYTLEPAAGAKDMFVREKTARHPGGALAIFADGSIRAVGPPSAAAPSPSQSAVAQTQASPASSAPPQITTPPSSPLAASPSVAIKPQTPAPSQMPPVESSSPATKQTASSPPATSSQTIADLATDFHPATSAGAVAKDIRGTISGMWSYFQDTDLSTTNGNDGVLRWKRHEKYVNSKQGYAGTDTDFGLIFPLISRDRLLDDPGPRPPAGSVMGHPSGRRYLAIQYRLAKTESISHLTIQYRFEKPNLFHQEEVNIIKNSGGADTLLFSKKDLGAGAANQVVTGTLAEVGTLGGGDSIWIMLGAAGDAAGDQTWLQVTLRGTAGN